MIIQKVMYRLYIKLDYKADAESGDIPDIKLK